MGYVLSLTFSYADGQKASLSIECVKPTISENQISVLMNTIIDKNIFLSKNGALAD